MDFGITPEEEHHWAIFQEVGPAAPGMQSLSFLELRAYALSTEQIQEPWEFRLLVAMSQNYVNGYALGSNVFSEVPQEPLSSNLLRELDHG